MKLKNQKNKEKEGSQPFYQDKKRLGWVIYSLLINNIISIPIYLILTLAEYGELAFFYVVFTSFQYDNELATRIIKNGYIDSINSIMTLNFCQYSVIGLVVINLLIVITIVILIRLFDSPEKAKQQSCLVQLFQTILILKTKVIFIFELALLLQVFKQRGMELENEIIIFIGASVAILIALIIEFVINHLLVVRLNMNGQIPWSHFISLHTIFYSLMKLAQGFFMAIHVAQVSMICMTIISAIVWISGIYFQPYHNESIQMLHTRFQGILFTLYFSSYFSSFLYQQNSNITILCILISFGSIFFSQLGIAFRQNMLKRQLLQGSLKTESEVEQGINIFLKLLMNIHQQAQQRDLLALFLQHKKMCINTLCFCQRFDQNLNIKQEQVKELKIQMQTKNITLRSIHLLQQDQEKSMKPKRKNQSRRQFDDYDTSSIQDEEFKNQQIENEQQYRSPKNTKTQGNIYEQQTTEKDNEDLNSSSKMLFKFSTTKSKNHIKLPSFLQTEDDSFGQNKMRMNIEDKNLSKNLNDQFVVHNADYNSTEPINKDQVLINSEHLLAYLMNENLDQTTSIPQNEYNLQKIEMILLVIFSYINDYLVKFDNKSVRIIMLKSYYELYMMRNKYLCHQSLTKISSINLSFLSYTQFLIDQQFVLDQAIEISSQNDQDVIDIDKLIANNIIFQEFYELNVETSYIVNQFWTMLANPHNLDVETFYKQGVEMSSMIKIIKQKFKQLQHQGQDKKNSTMYYIYANFNKYLLNSEYLHNEYQSKMMQIKSMNKTIRNTYKEILQTEVDKTGFIIVRGTFADFGNILFVNRALGLMLGYYPHELVGKLINTVMPSIISDKHHLFLQSFRQNGNPQFIETAQQLYIKNKTGHIQPFRVFVKFHYDKLYGHVFTAIINKVKHLYPYSNNKKYYCDEIMTIMTDNQGILCEITPSVTNFLGIPVKVVQQNQMFLQDNIKINHLLHIDIEQMDILEKKECLTTINTDFQPDGDTSITLLNQRQQSQEPTTQRGKSSSRFISNFNSKLKQKTFDSETIPNIEVRVKMVKICHKQVLTVRYFFIEMLNEMEFEKEKNVTNSNNFNYDDKQIFQASQIDRQEHYSSSGGGDSSNSLKDQFEAGLIEKEIDMLIRDDKRTPKNVKQIFWLILINFFTILTISSINLGMYISHTSLTEKNIDCFSYSLQRETLTSTIVNLFRSYIDIKEGIETNKTFQYTYMKTITNNSQQLNYDQYIYGQIQANVQSLKSIHQELNNVLLVKLDQDTVATQLKDYTIKVQNIDNFGNIQQQTQDFNTVINLFITTILNLLSSSDTRLLNNTYQFGSYNSHYAYIQALVAKNSTLYPILVLEQEMFFIFNNYKTSLVDSLNHISKIFKNNGYNSSIETIQKTMITIIISISTLLVVFILVTPIILKTVRQKYQVLLLFVDLEPEIVKECQLKSAFFENQFYTNRIKKLNFDYNPDFANDSQGSNFDRYSDIQYDEEASGGSDDAKSVIIKNQRLNQVQKLANSIKGKNKKFFVQQRTNFNQSDMDPLEDYDNSSRYNFDTKSRNLLKPNSEDSSQSLKSEIINKDLEDVLDIDTSKNQYQKSQFAKNKANKKFVSQFEDFSSESNVLSKAANKKMLYKNYSSTINTVAINPIVIEGASDKSKNSQAQSQSFYQQNEQEEIELEDLHKIFSLAASKQKKAKAKNKILKQNSIKSQDNISIGNQIDRYNDKNNTNSKSSITTLDNIQLSESKAKSNPSVDIQIQMQQDSKKALHDKIRKTISKSQRSLLVYLLLAIAMFSSYFIGIYLLSRFSFTELAISFDDLDTVYQRGNCLSKLFLYTREDFYANTSSGVFNFESDLNSDSTNQLWTCLSYEQQYSTIKKDNSNNFKQAMAFMKKLDSNQLCDITSELTQFTTSQCQSIQNALFNQGLTYSNQLILQQITQQHLAYYGTIANQRNNTMILASLRSSQLLELFYANELMLQPINYGLGGNMADSVKSFLAKLNKIHIIVYSLQLVISLTLIVYFLAYLYERLKKQTISGVTMLAILPKAQLTLVTQLQVKELLLS